MVFAANFFALFAHPSNAHNGNLLAYLADKSVELNARVSIVAASTSFSSAFFRVFRETFLLGVRVVRVSNLDFPALIYALCEKSRVSIFRRLSLFLLLLLLSSRC